MPRTRAATATPRVPANSILASAARLPTRLPPAAHGGSQDWQTQAWNYYETVGELSYAAGWYANALSRVTLRVKRETPDGAVDVEDGLPAEILEALYDGTTGQSQMMSAFGVHLFIPGECYLVGLTADPESTDERRAEERWLVCSTEEVKRKSGQWQIDRGDGKKETVEDTDFIIRIWRPHPRKFVQASSPVRAVLPVLQEILDLSSHIQATTQSRLAGAGVLLVPSEMTFDSPPTEDATAPTPPPDEPVNGDGFMVDLTDAMITPIKDRGSAAAAVPFVIKAPGAILGNIKHISFSTPFDAQVLPLRDNAIRRLALGLDLPPEVLLGVADANHWSAWQIADDAIKIHIEPVLELISNALTEQFLWPVMEGQGSVDFRDYFIDADTSDLRSRPDRSANAFQLHALLAIDDDALLRETGFDEADKPTPDELQAMILRRLAVAASDPQMSADALAALGVNVTPGQVRESVAEVVEEEAPAAVDGPPERAAASIQAACEVLIGRACERARNRVHHRSTTIKPIAPDRLDAALAGAWDEVPRTAMLLGVDPGLLVDRLDVFTRAVLTQGVDHRQPTVLARTLAIDP